MKKSNTEEFIEKAKAIHGNKYNYNDVIYVNNKSKIKIKCFEHGIFEQTPNNHLYGNGCIKCKYKSHITALDFIEKSKEKHGEKFIYDNTIFTKIKEKVTITCRVHGDFQQYPNDHLRGHGCLKCRNEQQTFNTQYFIQKAKDIHNNKYDYSKVEYIGAHKKVKIICSVHGEFEQTPDGHMRHGCNKCARELNQYDKYKNKPTTLYYIKIGDFFKIGLTRTSVEKRFKKEIESGLDIQIIKTLEFEDGHKALLLEQKVLQDTLENQVPKDESPIKGGWTEVRNKCFLDLIIKI